MIKGTSFTRLVPARRRHRVIGVVSAAMILACGGDGVTPPGDAASVLTSGTIVFAYTPQATKESLVDLYAALPDGTGLRLISALPGAELWPDLAPDGRRLVFTRKIYPDFGIWIENVDGTELRQLPTQGLASYARWSGDGQWIVFDRMGGLGLIRPDGSGLRSVSLPAPYVATIPAAISAQGRLVFTMDWGQESGTLWSSDLDGSKLVQLTTNGRDDEPRWSPDGAKLVVSSLTEGTAITGWDIVVMNADGSGRRILTPPGINIYPTWSPDGNWILYERWSDEVAGAEHCSLYRVPSAGGAPEALVIPMLSTGDCGGISWASAPLPGD